MYKIYNRHAPTFYRRFVQELSLHIFIFNVFFKGLFAARFEENNPAIKQAAVN